MYAITRAPVELIVYYMNVIESRTVQQFHFVCESSNFVLVFPKTS